MPVKLEIFSTTLKKCRGGLLPPYFFFFFERITLFISHHEETFPIGLIEINLSFIHKTIKSTLETPIFEGLFHPLKVFAADKKKYLCLSFSSTTTYIKENQVCGITKTNYVSHFFLLINELFAPVYAKIVQDEHSQNITFFTDYHSADFVLLSLKCRHLLQTVNMKSRRPRAFPGLRHSRAKTKRRVNHPDESFR